MLANNAQWSYSVHDNTFICEGEWSIHTIKPETISVTDLTASSDTTYIKAENLTLLDSAGALSIVRVIETLKNKGHHIVLQGFNEEQAKLLTLIEKQSDAIHFEITPPEKPGTIAVIGEESIRKLSEAYGFLTLVGDLSIHLFKALLSPRHLRIASIFSVLNSAGRQALPIIALLSFLIGVVLAYQMGLQLQTYGANIFIAYLSGMAIFREFAPLMTAIIVAGRTSSSFTAQIGSMKINEEIDAISAMGLSPTELLVLPKVLALLIVFPLMIFWSSFFSLIGSMVMSQSMLDIGYIDFLARLKESVGVKQLMLGLYKAPAFALIIAMVGCYQGFRVTSSADSLGAQTTKSVVQALFLIIITDAIYSVVYSAMGL